MHENAPETQETQGLAISLQKIAKNYGARQVLTNINLEIHAGEFIAIVGPSGCGKSTLLRLIAELEAPSAGNILYDQKNAQEAKLNKGDIRVMFQDSRLLPWKTLSDNVALGLATNQQENAQKLLQKVGLGERGNEWPAKLSGGQKQRASLARALASHPRLLLLDEPLGALDALTRIDMQRLIEKLWQDNPFTAILVTHDVSEAVALADRVLFLEEGKVALDLKISLARPRQKNSDSAWFEKKILDRILGVAEIEEAPQI